MKSSIERVFDFPSFSSYCNVYSLTEPPKMTLDMILIAMIPRKSVISISVFISTEEHVSTIAVLKYLKNSTLVASLSDSEMIFLCFLKDSSA
jgi:hypothetical protein